jgi:hypothetical protein
VKTGADGPGGSDFKEYRTKAEETHGVQFFTSLDSLPETDKPRLALISGRTADNPRLLSEAIKVRSELTLPPEVVLMYVLTPDME